MGTWDLPSSGTVTSATLEILSGTTMFGPCSGKLTELMIKINHV